MLRNLNQSYARGRVCGTNHSGVLSSVIPPSGDNGGSLLNSAVLGSDPVDCEYRVSIETWPSSGTLFVYEDGSFIFSDAADGTYTGTKRVYKNGADSGTSSYTFIVGGQVPGLIGAATADGSLAAIRVGDALINALVGAALANGSNASVTNSQNVQINGFVGAGIADGLLSSVSLAQITSAVVGAASAHGSQAFIQVPFVVSGIVGAAVANGLTTELVTTMSLIIEDGTAMPDSESYISVADADAYHSKRGNASWASLNNTAKEVALRKATDFMVGRYRMSWKGARVKPMQSLDWPRVGVVIEDIAGAMGRNVTGSFGYFQLDYQTVPRDIKNACAELALRASIGQLVTDQSQNVISETIGPIKILYDKDSSQQVIFVQVDMMLEMYMNNCGPTVKLTRA